MKTKKKVEIHTPDGWQQVTDFIIKKQQIYVLEINTAPGLSSHSIITQILSKAGYNINEILSLIINQQ